MKAIFESIYRGNLWGGRQSRSGSGSDLEETGVLIEELPRLFKDLKVRSILDIPCGDFNWFRKIDLGDIEYIGADIVPQIITDNTNKYPEIDFRVLDVVKDELPKVDLIFVRDCLGHLSNSDTREALRNIKQSGARYLVSTTFPGVRDDTEMETGGWRPINLERYGLTPKGLLHEEVIEGKCLGVYEL